MAKAEFGEEDEGALCSGLYFLKIFQVIIVYTSLAHLKIADLQNFLAGNGEEPNSQWKATYIY